MRVCVCADNGQRLGKTMQVATATHRVLSIIVAVGIKEHGKTREVVTVTKYRACMSVSA